MKAGQARTQHCLSVMSEHFRLTARQSLELPWLEDEDLYIDVLQELETSWMRACLARRRWHRALNTLKAMHTMKKLTFPDIVPGWLISPSTNWLKFNWPKNYSSLKSHRKHLFSVSGF